MFWYNPVLMKNSRISYVYVAKYTIFKHLLEIMTFLIQRLKYILANTLCE